MKSTSKIQAEATGQKLSARNRSKLNGSMSFLELEWTDRFKKEEELGSEGERESEVDNCFDYDFDSDEEEETENANGYVSEGSEESVEEGGEEPDQKLNDPVGNGGVVQKSTKKETPVLGLKMLNLLSFVVTRKKPTFKAKRDLRESLQDKGVDLKSSSMLTLVEMDELPDKGSMVARKNLRDDLLNKGVDLGGVAKSNIVAKRNLRANLSGDLLDVKKTV